MKAKVLYISTVGITMNFFKSLIPFLIQNGYQVDIATNTKEYKVDPLFKKLGCKIYKLPCTRNAFNIFPNFHTISIIKQIISKNNYQIVHCHTPVASFCTRIACNKFRKNGLSVIYTAHGFHFYKGAPILNWFLYYPLEKLCAKKTDVLITMNSEDYQFAKKKLPAKHIEYVHGVGIDTDKYKNAKCNINKLRKEIGVPRDAFLILSIGELNKNKNHKIVLEALNDLHNSNIYYAIAGVGSEKAALLALAKKYNLENNFKLLGYRNDIPQLLKASNLFIISSFREGLPLAPLEALASGLPVIASNIRGCKDLINKFFLFDVVDKSKISSLIINLINNETNILSHEENLINYSCKNVNNEVLKIYYKHT